MKFKNIIFVVIGSIVCSSLYAVTQFRSPLSLERGYLHYPLVYPQHSWWYDRAIVYCEREDSGSRIWNLEKYIGGYYRCANRAFFNCADTSQLDECSFIGGTCARDSHDVCCHSGSTTKTATLSQLWFGKQAFTVAEAFAGGAIEQPGENPFVTFAQVTPRFSYTERGGYVGAHFEHRFAGNMHWALGARVSLPFKMVEITQDYGCCDTLEEGLSNVIFETVFSDDADSTRNDISYAYRLDFLSTLIRRAIPVSDSRPLIQYGDATSPTRIAGNVVGGLNAPATYLPVYVTRATDGNFPNTPFEKKGSTVVTALAADGAGGVNGTTLSFSGIPNDYSAGMGANPLAQRQLYLVPRLLEDGTALDANAVAIRSAIRAILDTLEFNNMDSAVEFLRSKCIDLSIDERRSGLGDLRCELYGQYEGNNWFIDMILGSIFPTGKKVQDARKVFLMSTGDNGHYQLLAGLEGGWRPRDWFAFKIYAMFNHAFKGKEIKAAPFVGATIKNIGPNVEATVSWNQFEMRTDLNFFHPCNTDLGCVLGYELFVKGHDRVSLCACTAVDLLGNRNTLDPNILEDRTNAITHKIEGEMFSRWDFCELFMGASHIVAGKNAMQETEAHIGMVIYF